MNRTRFQRPKLTSAHVIAVLALVLGMAGSATAAALITGKQIANGTVTTNDIKDKSLLVRDIKPAERAKLKGPSPYAPPPSGKLIKGGGIVSGYLASASSELRGYAPLGIVPAQALSEDDPARTIYFAPSLAAEDGDENGTLCQGTDLAPVPSPGILCVYIANYNNVETGSANVFAGVETTADGADNAGFMVTPDSAAAGVMTFRYVWAYRAP